MKKNLIIAAMTTVVAVISIAPSAHANDQTEIFVGNTLVFLENDAGSQGDMSVSGKFDGWNVRYTALTYNTLGSQSNPKMDLKINSISGDAALDGTLTILFSADNFFNPNPVGVGDAVVSASSSEAPGTGSTLAGSFSAFYDPANELEGASSLLSGLAIPGTASGGGFFSDFGPYSLTEAVIINSGSGTLDPDFSLSVSAPDGGLTLLMLGGAMIGLAGIHSKFASRRA